MGAVKLVVSEAEVAAVAAVGTAESTVEVFVHRIPRAAVRRE